MATQNTYLQAIETRWHGPTDKRPSRISARCDARTIFVSYDHALPSSANHRAAAEALVAQLGWLENGERLFGGAMPGNHPGYAFVIVTADDMKRGR